MLDDRIAILKMLEEGKITAEEASKLLDALQASDARGQATLLEDARWEPPRKKAKWMRIEVNEKTGNRVHVKLPVAIVKAAMRIGGGHIHIGGFNSDELGPELMEEIEQALIEGETGLLVDVVDDSGDHVQIYLE